MARASPDMSAYKYQEISPILAFLGNVGAPPPSQPGPHLAMVPSLAVLKVQIFGQIWQKANIGDPSQDLSISWDLTAHLPIQEKFSPS